MSKLKRVLTTPIKSLYLTSALLVLLIVLYINADIKYVPKVFSKKQVEHSVISADTKESTPVLINETKNINTETNLSTLLTDTSTPVNVHAGTRVVYMDMDNEVLNIPYGMTSGLFADGKLTSCPDKMLLEFRVRLRSECFQPYTHKECTSASKNISVKIEGNSSAYELTSPDSTFRKPNIFIPNSKGEFTAYLLVGSQYQYYEYGGSGCWGVQPSVAIHVFKNDVAIGTSNLPDSREKYLGYLFDRDLQKGLDKEINFIARTKTPYEIPVFLEELPEQNTKVKKYLELNANYILVCNNGMVPCSVQGDYDGDKKQDVLFSVKNTNDNKVKFIAAMGSDEYVTFDPCDYGIWKTIKGKDKDKDVVFIDDVERSSCILKWNGTTLWGPPGLGD